MKLAATFQRHAHDGDSLRPDIADALSPTQLISDAEGKRLLFVARQVMRPSDDKERGTLKSDQKNPRANFLIVTQPRKTFYTVSLLVGAADVLCTALLLSVADGVNTSKLVGYCILTVIPSILFVAACMTSSQWLCVVAICSETLNIFSLFVVVTNSLLLRLIFTAIELMILVRHRSFITPSLYTL